MRARGLGRAGMAAMLAALALLAGSLQADESTLGAAGVGARWLDLPSSARQSALSGAYAAAADDVESLGVNPAGLADLSGPQAVFSHFVGPLGVSKEHLAGAIGIGAGQGLGLKLDYVDFGSVDNYSLDGEGAVIANGSSHPYAGTASLGWGVGLGSIRAGASAAVLFQDLGTGTTDAAAALDLGLKWAVPETGLSAGLSLLNFGTPLAGASLPMEVRGGLAYQGAALGRRYKVDADVNLYPGQEPPQALLGAEISPVEHLWVRAGYAFGNADQVSGSTVGLGLSGLGILTVDYAFINAGALGVTQQVSLRTDFGD